MNGVRHLQSFSLKDVRYWLLGIAAGLEIIFLTLVWKADDIGHLGMSILLLLAAGTLVWEKHHDLNFESGILPSLLGAGLISWVLWQSTNLIDNYTLRLLSFTSALGVSLLASGFKGLRQYWQELVILFFLGVPSVIAFHLFDISSLTAEFGASLLWYSGFDVSVQGIDIFLPEGGVKVVYRCSGIETINYLLAISVTTLVMFPISGIKRFFVPILAILLGFFVNGIRVALLAILAISNRDAFHSLHGGTASYFFAMIGILVFGTFYWFLLQQEENQSADESEEADNA
ncbi:MAG: cyanoexosortase A [Cyanobacteria bacterium CRU_2_1]|nr:cyanoexosortase A [Cyanobacteria bacterium RU_5_0]NJR60316.1 cyanoexosortase A [Cyanobacteria bacterium CRU_2_1]